MNILGVRIDNVTQKEAHQKVFNFLQSGKQHTIFTPNPEMLVDAHNDTVFQDILNKGSLNLCDGKGIQFVAKEPIERISGADFMLDVCAIAEQLGKSVYLLGTGNSEVLYETEKTLNRMFPNLNIIGTHPGHRLTITQFDNGTMELQFDKNKNNELIDTIRLASPYILLVAFGHNKQERWIDLFLKDLPSVKIAMGVGGSFDFLAGKIWRAPRWMRKLGLEWLWRLSQEPWRIKRIWKATVTFLLLHKTYARKQS